MEGLNLRKYKQYEKRLNEDKQWSLNHYIENVSWIIRVFDYLEYNHRRFDLDTALQDFSR